MSLKNETAEWGQVVQEGVQKYRDDAMKVLSDAAAKGHFLPPGFVQKRLLDLGIDVKRKLTKANAKIYEEELGRQFKLADTNQKVAVGLAKIDLKTYKARLENQEDIDRASADADLKKRRADLEILKAQVDLRQAAIIEERAKIEATIIYWKRLVVAAEGPSLDADIALINEKVRTAELKLTIIPYLQQVIAAEQLVVAAEQRRAAILQLVADAEMQVADVKETEIPLLLEKAAARIQEAAAVTDEAGWKQRIEELGYRRVDLKIAEEAADHQVRLAELLQEEAHYEQVRAGRILSLAHMQAQTALAQYEEVVRAEIIERSKLLKEDESGYKQELAWFWKDYELVHKVMDLELDKLLFQKELAVRLHNLTAEGRDACLTKRASGRTVTQHKVGSTRFIYIDKG